MLCSLGFRFWMFYRTNLPGESSRPLVPTTITLSGNIIFWMSKMPICFPLRPGSPPGHHGKKRNLITFFQGCVQLFGKVQIILTV